MNYELTAPSVGFQFRIRHDSGQTVTINVKMKPYDNRMMIQLLKDQAGHMQAAKDDIDAWDVKGGQPTASREFFDRHIIEVKMNGVVLNDEQISKLDARWDFKNVVIENGLNGISRVILEDEEQQELTVDEILGSAVIHTKFAIADDMGAEQTVLIDHAFDYPNAMDSLSHERASIQQGLRQGGFRVQYNHEALTTLYNKKIQSVTGLVLEGQPCTRANKSEWIDKVPYLMKRAALGFLFSRAERAVRGNG